MTPAALAAMLTGREIGSEVDAGEETRAKAAGLVVVFGASDDLMEFRGAICDEVGAHNGTTARVTRTGLLPDWESLDKDDEDAARDYFTKHLLGFAEIEALWAAEGDYSWTFRTALPHATFEVVEDGEPYCRGIVFALADVCPSAVPELDIRVKGGELDRVKDGELEPQQVVQHMLGVDAALNFRLAADDAAATARAEGFDIVAMDAMRALIASTPLPGPEHMRAWCETIAAGACGVADEMLRQRDRRAAGSPA